MSRQFFGGKSSTRQFVVGQFIRGQFSGESSSRQRFIERQFFFFFFGGGVSSMRQSVGKQLTEGNSPFSLYRQRQSVNLIFHFPETYIHIYIYTYIYIIYIYYKYIYIACIGVSPPSFLPNSTLKSANCQSPPFQAIPPCILFFCLPLIIRFLSKPLQY